MSCSIQKNVKKCQCIKCDCPNEIREFGHRYEKENAIVEAEFENDADKVESIIENICDSCEKGQHQDQPNA